MAADRSPFICQTQSLNLFVRNPTFKTLNAMHFYSWKKSLKTGCYYLRSQAKTAAQKFSVDLEQVKKENKVITKEEPKTESTRKETTTQEQNNEPPECLMCSA